MKYAAYAKPYKGPDSELFSLGNKDEILQSAPRGWCGPSVSFLSCLVGHPVETVYFRLGLQPMCLDLNPNKTQLGNQTHMVTT